MRHIYRIQKLVTSPRVADWCQLPYLNHPKGCPNYNKSAKCPPNAPFVADYFDILRPLYFVASYFNLTAHVEHMRNNHPDWSDRQCRCVLYWQGTSRSYLRKHYKAFMGKHSFNAVTECPEGMGVNVYATAQIAGLYLESIRKLSLCRHVALVGYRK